MELHNKKIIGIFRTQEEAFSAIQRLRDNGYRENEISIISKDAFNLSDRLNQTNINVDHHDLSKNADGFVGGAVTGGALGGIGLLLLELGAIAIPGVGPFIAAGPIAALLTGAIAGGTVGGILGALVDLGVPEDLANEYNEYLERGDILVLVDSDESRSGDIYDNFYDNNSVIRDRYDRTNNRNGYVNNELNGDNLVDNHDRKHFGNDGRDLGDTIEGNWQQLKGNVQKRWGLLTNDDLDVVNGSRKVLIGKIHERYGINLEDAEREVMEYKFY